MVRKLVSVRRHRRKRPGGKHKTIRVRRHRRKTPRRRRK